MATPAFGLQGAEAALIETALGTENVLRQGGLQARLALQQGAGGALDILGQGQTQGRLDLQQGQTGALGALTQAQAAANQQAGQGIAGVQQFVGAGANAQQLQAALSGAQGQDAFNAALTESAPQRFLREQGRNELLAASGATGGLGGGAIRKELVRFGQGQAGQQLQQQISNLGALSGQGLAAAGQVGALRGQQAAGTRQLGQAGAGFQAQTGQALAGLGQVASQTGAGIVGQTGQALAGLERGVSQDVGSAFTSLGAQAAANRFRTGQDIAGAVGGTSSALSNLISQQGSGLSSIIESGGGNLANILTQAGQTAGLSDEQLAALIANISTGQATTVAGLPGVPGVQQTSGIIGAIGQGLEGAGTALALSDVRLKQNIRPIGSTPAGLGLYSWDWIEGMEHLTANEPTFGVLAQEVEFVQPGAVVQGVDGFLRVDYSEVA